MHNHHDKIRLLPCPRNILTDLILIFQKMNHTGIFLWNGNSVRPICIVEHSKPDPVPGYHLKGAVPPLLLRLDAKTRDPSGIKEFFREIDAFPSPVKGMVGSAGHNRKTCVRNGLSHLGRSPESGIAAVPGGIVRKRRLLIDHGNVVFRNNILKVIIQKIKGTLMN